MTAQPPPVKDAFDFFYPPLMYTGEHTWASVYPFGHPAALALGSIFGLMWLVPAVMGAGTAIFLYLVGRRLYGNATGVVAIVLLASSPFFLMTASNFMSHNTAAFYLTAALFFVVNRDRPRLYGALAGLFYGLLINTRTLTAVGLMIPLGIVFLGRLLPPRTRITAAKHFAAFAVFACVMAGAYLWYNYAITGDPLKSPYEAVGNLSEWFGFSGRHTLASGLQNEQVQMATLLVVFNGWPRYFGLVLVMTPFLLGTRNRWDYFLLTCALIDMALWTLYEGHGIMHGPRYWYEAMPFLMLLAARGVESAAGFMAWAAAVVRHRLGAVDSLDAKLAGYTITHSVLALLVWYSLSGWLLGSRDPGWSIDFVPNRASALRGFNGVDEEFVKFMKRAPPDGSLVLIEQCPSWHCYGLVFGLNSPFLDSDVVFARNIPARNRETFEAFPGRHVFIAKYRMKELRPYGSLSAAE